ncbi:MAG: four helix bundle protein [Candidatus Cloacimonetes bacterium]|nr:four helix bundle protein [Candidatus Cloacimonadota bacterium]
MKEERTFAFEKLRVWQDSRSFVTKIYLLTKEFPKEERYGLVDQLRRAAISISSNIAEGSSRISFKDQSHFYQIAYSSLMEVLNQIIICLDLNYLTKDDYNSFRSDIESLSYQINQLRKSALSKLSQPPSTKPSQQSQQRSSQPSKPFSTE